MKEELLICSNVKNSVFFKSALSNFIIKHKNFEDVFKKENLTKNIIFFSSYDIYYKNKQKITKFKNKLLFFSEENHNLEKNLYGAKEILSIKKISVSNFKDKVNNFFINSKTLFFDIAIFDQKVINLKNEKFCFFTIIENEIFKYLIKSKAVSKYDIEKESFVEPYLPHTKIGIMHLAAGIWSGKKDMRIFKDVKIKIKTTSGKVIEKSLRYQ